MGPRVGALASRPVPGSCKSARPITSRTGPTIDRWTQVTCRVVFNSLFRQAEPPHSLGLNGATRWVTLIQLPRGGAMRNMWFVFLAASVVGVVVLISAALAAMVP
jgi:hypothetical protein